MTNRGRKFLGDFKELYTKAFIDHYTTSRDHPEADGMAKRVVKTNKRGLKKYGLLRESHMNWELISKPLWCPLARIN